MDFLLWNSLHSKQFIMPFLLAKTVISCAFIADEWSICGTFQDSSKSYIISSNPYDKSFRYEVALPMADLCNILRFDLRRSCNFFQFLDFSQSFFADCGSPICSLCMMIKLTRSLKLSTKI